MDEVCSIFSNISFDADCMSVSCAADSPADSVGKSDVLSVYQPCDRKDHWMQHFLVVHLLADRTRPLFDRHW
ncbi:hypothetical protein [Candidatus Ichthyocystis sparus]|uniref:hypothetical protein n=1 Tax=Candidatus Ichthyocystis sparus TaxID=1561004 RepID=UPI001146A568|nr:hypothetical protein [Candidatus Ichthyocystis sparus]